MLGIELSNAQKVQVGFILIILAIAGVFIFKSSRPGFDSSINSYTETKRAAANNGRITTTNPADPKKEEFKTIFASNDGRMEIIEYKNDPAAHPRINWLPETRIAGKVYLYYRDPMTPVEKIKDPFRHALAYAAYNNIFGRPLGLLGSAGMTPDQVTKEGAARQLMTSEVNLINSSVTEGTYHSDLMDKVMTALGAYNAKSGDPLRDAPKASLAQKVLEAAAAFQDQVLKDKYIAIDKYMNVVEAFLTSDQKTKVIAAVTADMAKKTARGPAPAAGRRGTGARGTRAGNPPPARGTTPPAATGGRSTLPQGG